MWGVGWGVGGIVIVAEKEVVRATEEGDVREVQEREGKREAGSPASSSLPFNFN